MYTADTNALIYFLAKDPLAVAILEEPLSVPGMVYASTMTELELLSLPTLTVVDMDRIERLLLLTIVLPIDSRIAQIAGSLRRTHRLKTPDSAIAATALLTGTTLVTRDVRDFRRVSELRIQEI